MSFFLLFLDATPLKTLLLFFNVIPTLVFNTIPPTPFQCWFMFFFDTTLAPIPWHPLAPFYCSSSMSFFLLFFDNDPILIFLDVTHALLLRHSCSSYFKDLSTPPVSNWYSPPLHVFVGMGRISFPNSTFILQARLEGEFFFFSNVCLLVAFVPCFDCPCFFLGNFG